MPERFSEVQGVFQKSKTYFRILESISEVHGVFQKARVCFLSPSGVFMKFRAYFRSLGRVSEFQNVFQKFLGCFKVQGVFQKSAAWFKSPRRVSKIKGVFQKSKACFRSPRSASEVQGVFPKLMIHRYWSSSPLRGTKQTLILFFILKGEFTHLKQGLFSICSVRIYRKTSSGNISSLC